jgi:hypothetical protein
MSDLQPTWQPMEVDPRITINPVAQGSNRRRNRWLRRKRRNASFRSELESQQGENHVQQTDPGHVDVKA